MARQILTRPSFVVPALLTPGLVRPFGPPVSGGGAPVPPAGVANALALLHFDGADGGSPVTDEVGTMTWTARNSAVLDDAQAQFGPTSALFDGVNQNLLSTTSVNLSTGPAGGWTVESRVRMAATPSGVDACWAIGNAAGWAPIWMRFTDIGGGDIRMAPYSSSNSASWDTLTGGATGTTFNAGQWYHIAATFDPVDNMIYVYVDGVLETSSTPPSTYNYACDNSRIGGRYDDTNEAWNGWVDEFLMTLDCRYPGGASFTPPGTPYSL